MSDAHDTDTHETHAHEAHTGGLHARLRDETDALHRQVERESVLSGLMGPAVSGALYREALLLLHGVYAAHESSARAALAGSVFATFLATHGPREDDLVADLAACGMDVLPRPEALLPAGFAEAVGVLYVLEGASAGALMIGQHLPGALDCVLPAPALYHPADPTGLARRWRGFRRVLNCVEPEPGMGDAAVAAACAVFRRFLSPAESA